MELHFLHHRIQFDLGCKPRVVLFPAGKMICMNKAERWRWSGQVGNWELGN